MKPKRRNRRLSLIGIGAICIIAAISITLNALNNSVSYFFTPSQLFESSEIPTKPIRLGGLVMDGSVIRSDGVETRFRITDGEHQVDVLFSGVLPDLFREGQGVIAEGTVISKGEFEAHTVLAKHDENYVPKELQHTINFEEESQ